jgi:hypothetical protein
MAANVSAEAGSPSRWANPKIALTDRPGLGARDAHARRPPGTINTASRFERGLIPCCFFLLLELSVKDRMASAL